MSKNRPYPGYYIAFEAIDCAGKTTQIERVKHWLDCEGFSTFFTREPGGTDSPVAEQIRQIILNPENKDMTPKTEALLFAASRAQAIPTTIRPHLEAGDIVISDRSVYSSYAYQGCGRELFASSTLVEDTNGNLTRRTFGPMFSFNRWATEEYLPDCIFYLRIPYEVMLERKAARGIPTDRIEAEQHDFYEKVIAEYDRMARSRANFVAIDGTKDADTVYYTIINVLRKFMMADEVGKYKKLVEPKKIYRNQLDYLKMGKTKWLDASVEDFEEAQKIAQQSYRYDGNIDDVDVDLSDLF